MEHRRRIVVDDVDGAAGRPAAEQRRTRALQNFDPPHPVERVREAAELIAVGETVGIDLGVQAADQKMVEIAQRILPAGVDAAGVGDRFLERRGTLFGENFAGNDLNADGQVGNLGAGLAGRRHLLQWRPGVVVVRAIAVVGRLRSLCCRPWRGGAGPLSPCRRRSRRRRLFLLGHGAVLRRVDVNGRKLRLVFLRRRWHWNKQQHRCPKNSGVTISDDRPFIVGISACQTCYFCSSAD